MKYKFKEGDRVRVKPEVNLSRLSIVGERGEEVSKELKETVQVITDATPGCEGWMDKELNGEPTYSVGDERWRIPESFLKKEK